MVDLQGQYQKIKSEIRAAHEEILDSCAFVNGPYVHAFAADMQAYLDVKHVLPCANGTDALQIALMALDLKPGDEVITTPFTFIATAEVIALLGLIPKFVDVHEDTFNINEESLEAAIGPKTKAIIPVHLFGQAAHMEKIMAIAEAHNIAVIEDNAQAIGADYTFSNGKQAKAGTIGHIGTTSFFPSKNLGCYGDGGALFTNDDALAHKIKVISNHGSSVRYYHDEVGVNSRLDSLQAAVLKVKLQYLDDYAQARQQAAARYDELLSPLSPVQVPARASFSNHVFHQYTLRIDQKRDQVAAYLKEQKIPNGVYYPVPLHMQKAYKMSGYQEGDFPVSERLSKVVISLPMHTELDAELQAYICDSLKTALNQ